MKNNIEKIFYRILLAAGMMLLLTGCGLAEQVQELKSEIMQKETEVRKKERPAKKKKSEKKQIKETEVVLESEEPASTETESVADKTIAEPGNFAYRTLNDTESRFIMKC